MKPFLWTFAAVIVGIWVYAKLSKRATVNSAGVNKRSLIEDPVGFFFGPNIDPMTGAYLPAPARAGTIMSSTSTPGLQGGNAS